jgi:hypothetical protein
MARANAACMTPERLNILIEHCFPRRGEVSLSAHEQGIARFLGISPVTLRHYLSGELP